MSIVTKIKGYWLDKNKNSAIYLFFVSIFLFITLYWASCYLTRSLSDSNLQLYALILCMSLSFVLVSRMLVAFALPDEGLIFSKYGMALNLGGVLFLTLIYGPQILIKFYEYDDWVYLGFKYSSFGLAYLNEPVNFHYVPVLKLVLYLIDYLSDPTYVGNAATFLFVNIFLMTCFLELALRVLKNKVLAFLIVALFGVWPSAEMARYWFGGGFWLVLPLPFYLLLLMQVMKQTSGKTVMPMDLVMIFFLSSITVLSSSQILIPAVGMFTYALVYQLCIAKPNPRDALKRLVPLALCILIPTAYALAMRSSNPGVSLNLNGLIDGSYLRNFLLFIAVKIIYIKWFSILLMLQFILIVVLISWRGVKLADFIGNERMSMVIGLMAFSLASYMLFVLQVGMARSWETYAILTPYYASYPLLCCFLFGTSLVALFDIMARKDVSAISRIGIKFSEIRVLSIALKNSNSLLVISMSVMLLCASSISSEKYKISSEHIEKVKFQRIRVAEFGEAVCDVLKKSNTNRLELIAARPLSDCKDCELLFNAPQSFLDYFSTDKYFHHNIAKRFSESQCPAYSSRLVMDGAPGALVTTGLDVSDKMKNYYSSHYRENINR